MKMSFTSNWSIQQERDQAKNLYAQGETISAIAKKLDRSVSAVYEWVSGNKGKDKYTIQEWKGKADAAEKQTAVNLYNQHLNIQKVCELMDRSYDTVRRWLLEQGVDTSPKHQKKTDDLANIKHLENKVAELQAENIKLKAALKELLN